MKKSEDLESSDPELRSGGEANSTAPFTFETEPRRKASPNTIYECWKCARLVETQFYFERPIVPRFCPWCGKPPSTILGREIDGYRIDEVISRGGFGIIYLASNVAQPAMKAAIKFLRPEMAYYRPELVKIFIEEARLTEAIGQTCWNIVRLSNVREKPWPYYFMEYIRGPTLEDLIESQRPQRLPLRDCIGFLRGIAKALAVTHSHGRIHRDLKPLNIMVIRAQEIAQPEERIKLLDFGLAMKIAHRRGPDHSGASASGLTTGESDSPIQGAGTPEYMPPESFDGINEFAGDIYSFGVTAYEILTSQRPWKDPSRDTERYSYWRDCHKRKPPRPLRELRSEVPKWLARVVTDCLAKDPRKRMAETEQLIRRLREPASRWLKLSGAAAAAVFAVLLWLALAGGKTKETLRWNLPPGSPAVVYASSETDLRARRVVASLSSRKEITACSTSLPDVVDCAVEGGTDIALKFKTGTGQALLGRTIEVRGGGSGFFFEDAVRFEEDREPPRFETLRCGVVGGEPGPLKPGMRLRSEKSRFVFDLSEPHLAPSAGGAFVTAPATPDAGEKRSTIEKLREGTNEFILPPLDEGRYRGRFEVQDQAGNPGRSEDFEFIVDNNIGFLIRPEQFLVASKMAHYEFSVAEGEEIVELSVVDEAGERRRCQVILHSPSAPTTVDLVRQRGSLGPVRFPLPAGDHILAVPLEAREGTFAFTLVVESSSTPPQRAEFNLAGRSPPPARPEDVQRISLEGQVFSLPVTRDQAGAPAPVRLAGAVERIRIECAPAVFLRAEADLPSGKRGSEELDVASDSVMLRDLGLVPDRDNPIALRLYDAMERPTEVKLLIHQDTVKPRIEKVVARSRDGKEIALGAITHGYNAARGGDEVSLVVESDEPLSRVTASAGGAEIRGGTPSADGRSFKFASLKEPGLGDGSHQLQVTVYDQVGNSGPRTSFELNLNAGSPEVKLRNEDLLDPGRQKLLLKNQDTLELDLIDGNGIDEKRTKVAVRRGQNESAIAPTFGRLAEGKTPCKLSLKHLGEGSGQFVVEAVDRFGLSARQVFAFEFNYEREFWEEVEYLGVLWVRPPRRGRPLKFYLSRTEISNAQFNRPEFIRGGRYLRQDLQRYGKPKYWGKGAAFPRYLDQDGKELSGDRYPVVGVPARVAQAFARDVFGARLPTWGEWREAALLDDESLSARYPWNEKDTALGWNSFNHSQIAPGTSSRLGGHRTRGMLCPWSETPRLPQYAHVEVDLDPYPEELKQKYSFCVFLHLLGNVGEIVARDLKQDTFGVAGSDCGKSYADSAIRDVPGPYNEDNLGNTGFRLLMPLDDTTPPEFLRKAVRPRGGRE